VRLGRRVSWAGLRGGNEGLFEEGDVAALLPKTDVVAVDVDCLVCAEWNESGLLLMLLASLAALLSTFLLAALAAAVPGFVAVVAKTFGSGSRPFCHVLPGALLFGIGPRYVDRLRACAGWRVRFFFLFTLPAD
jgi:hypothetical protein